MVGGPPLNVVHLIGETNALAFDEPLARPTLDDFSRPT